MGLDNGLADGEAQTGARVAKLMRTILLFEPLEQPRPEFGRNAGPFISDTYPDDLPCALKRNANMASGGREFACV